VGRASLGEKKGKKFSKYPFNMNFVSGGREREGGKTNNKRGGGEGERRRIVFYDGVTGKKKKALGREKETNAKRLRATKKRRGKKIVYKCQIKKGG